MVTNELLVRGVELRVALEIRERNRLHVRVALEVVPVDADVAVLVLVDDANAQAVDLDCRVARAAARMGAPGALNDVRAIARPRRLDAVGVGRATDEAHVVGRWKLGVGVLELGEWGSARCLACC